MLRIIDNKRIDLTDSEFQLYQEISKSYDRPNFEGKDLFKGLFETDKNGRIIFLRPPTSKFSSMEVYMFLINIMVHQHLGDACLVVENTVAEGQKVIKECKQLLEELKTEKNKRKKKTK